MWLTGRSWWHFGLYHPGLKKIGRDLSVIEIERDEAYIDELRTELAIFDNYVESIKQDILNSHQAPLKYPMHEEPAQQPLIEEEIVF